MRGLILNADDFGLTPGVNRSITELHCAGALTSVTLMASGSAFEDACERAAANPELGVGCHIVLVDGIAMSLPERVPTLATSGGDLRPTLGTFVRDLFLGRVSEEDIEAEAKAQIGKLQRAGIRVTHIDTHKHAHMFPAVFRAVLRAAAACGVRAIRNPFEPDWAIAATTGSSWKRAMQVRALRRFRKPFLKEVARAGLHTTDGAVGVLATGVLDEVLLPNLLDAMPPGTWELVCHPGFQDQHLDAVRTRLRASREIEHRALLATAGQFPGIARIHFGDLSS